MKKQIALLMFSVIGAISSVGYSQIVNPNTNPSATEGAPGAPGYSGNGACAACTDPKKTPLPTPGFENLLPQDGASTAAPADSAQGTK